MNLAQRERQKSVSVKLYWLPLGAGDTSSCVRWNGRIFEAITAWHQHRHARDLYHSALIVQLGDDRYVIEMAPAWGNKAPDRGVVSEGAVGLPRLGGSRFSATRSAAGATASSQTSPKRSPAPSA